MTTLPTPGLEFVTRLEVTVADVVDVGRTDAGHRRIANIDGGTMDGPHLRGRVLPGGADWQAILADGAVSVDTRYNLETDDGAILHIRTAGVRAGPDAVMDAVARGEDVDPSTYYFRAAAWFETEVERYRWLTRAMVVCSAARLPSSVVVDAYTLT